MVDYDFMSDQGKPKPTTSALSKDRTQPRHWQDLRCSAAVHFNPVAISFQLHVLPISLRTQLGIKTAHSEARPGTADDQERSGRVDGFD